MDQGSRGWFTRSCLDITAARGCIDKPWNGCERRELVETVCDDKPPL